MIPPLLRQVTFRRFWTGQVVSLFGDQVSLFAVPLTAVLVLHAGPEQMGLLTAAGLLPSLLFSLLAGSLVDRRGQRRRTMLGADLVRAGLMVSIPVAYACGVLVLPQLYAVAFAVGICDVFFAVAYSTLFVSVVPPADYLAGQSLLNGSRAMSFVVGQSAAGLLVAAFTAPGAIVLDALSFLGSAFALKRIDPAEPVTSGEGHGSLAAGITFIRRSATIRAALRATATVNFFTLAFNAIFILYATRSLHVRPAVLGFVLGAGAVGALLGSVVTGRIARRIGVGRAFALGCVAFPAPLALAPLAAGPTWMVLGALFLAEFGSGLGVMILDISIGAIFATEIPDRLRARVSGAYRSVNYGIRPLGALTGGFLGGALGLRPTLWLAVVGGCTCALWLVRSPILALRDRGEDRSPATGSGRQRADAASGSATSGAAAS